MIEDNPQFQSAVRALHDKIAQSIAPNVLIVDDCEDDVIILRHALKEVSPHIRTHWRAEKPEVVAIVSSEPIDLVLLDLRLGLGMTGVEVLKAIRAVSRVPVAGITGSDSSTAVWKEAMDAGMEAIFRKPMSPEIIRKLLTL